ncbi:MAG: hypothetical protein CM1200mP12_20300 [Gammaproteobacteria bacterium]|nr:MAG: hypothetical protein CM1200mP12_20300 [Gammaproteobacteria bacterium]
MEELMELVVAGKIDQLMLNQEMFPKPIELSKK